MNYDLVVDTSNFKPFDTNLAMQVLHDYRDAYYKLEDQINKIAEEKGEYVLPESSKYKGVMDRYNEDYDAAVADFSKGMNLRNAQAIRNLRRRYYNEISPIRTMVENYNKYNDKLTSLGSDAIIGNIYQVDDFYGGTTPAINYRSGKQVEADSIKYFSGINNALTQDPTFRQILGNQYYLETQKGGLDSGNALKAALVEYNNATNGTYSREVQDLINHMNNVMEAESVGDFSEDAKRQVWNKIASGLVASITAPKYDRVINKGYSSPSEVRQMASLDAKMAEDGLVYNPKTQSYEYNEDVAKAAKEHLYQKPDGTTEEVTLPDNITWRKIDKDKWITDDPKYGGIPRTTSQLISLDKQIRTDVDKAEKDKAKKEEEERKNAEKAKSALYGEPGKRTEKQYLELGKQFKPLNYTGWSSNSTQWEDNTNDSRYYYSRPLLLGGSNAKLSDKEKENLNPKIKNDILDKIKDQNPTLNIGWEDLDIYEDNDWFSNNHYRVVIKGTGERGLYDEEQNIASPSSNNTIRQPIVPGDTTVVKTDSIPRDTTRTHYRPGALLNN